LDGECGAYTLGAINIDTAAHFLDYAFADTEAQASALGIASGVLI
jgi:hypothetical protein